MGEVRDARGEAVAGALVALTSDDGVLDRATTGPDGAFRFEVEPGDYGLSAVAADRAAAFACVAAPSAPVRLALGTAGTTVQGQVTTGGGRALAGAELTIVRFSGDACDVFAASTGDDGRYRVTLPASEGVEVSVRGAWEGDPVTVGGSADLAADLSVDPRPAPGPAPDEVVAWMKANAVPLATVEPGSDHADLEPLRDIVGDARLVALGEATHGTREFFQVKHRMLAFLVEEMGFRAFAMEASMPEAFDIDRYVLTGEGDPRSLLGGLHFWTWHTEEVLALVEWLRAYNADHPDDPVRFYGFDMQSPARASVALDFLGPDGAALRGPLEAVTDPFLASVFPTLPAERKSAARAAATDLIARLEAHQPHDEAWQLARQHARVLDQYLDMALAGAGEGFVERDRAMAENVGWILERSPGGAVLWAHDGHVSRSGLQGMRSMGQALAERYGQGYRAIGLAFDRGGFQAQDHATGLLREFTMPSLPEGSLDQTLARAGSRFLLDLRDVPADGPVGEWFASRHPMHLVGSGFAEEAVLEMVDNRRVALQYDALVFVDQTTAARPNHRREDVDRRALDEPTNLTFDDGSSGWSTGRWLEQRGYRLQVVRGRARIAPSGDRRYGSRPAVVEQRISAGALAGGVEFRARARGADAVYVYAKLSSGWGGDSAVAWARVAPGGWRDVPLSLPAEADGETLTVGLAVTGEARGWLDEVHLERRPGN